MSVWPSLIYLLLVLFSLGVNAGKDEKMGTMLLANVITLSLLWWGGFFDPLIRGG